MPRLQLINSLFFVYKYKDLLVSNLRHVKFKDDFFVFIFPLNPPPPVVNGLIHSQLIRRFSEALFVVVILQRQLVFFVFVLFFWL